MNIEFNVSTPVTQLGDTRILGHCEWRSSCSRSDSPIEVIASVDTIDDLLDVLDSVTGFFSIITPLSECWAVAVDCVDSIPLYYTETDEGYYVTDSQTSLIESATEFKVDPVSVAEYENIGYVTSTNLLYDSLKITEAATVYRFSEDRGVTAKRYFDFEYSDNPVRRETADLKQILDEAIERLITYADGRQVWVPLSGGQDSRLLVTGLVDAGYDNLYAYSYGTNEDETSEAAISQRVAESLDVDWHFCRYTAKEWYDWYRTDKRYQHDRNLFLRTVPPIKELPALCKFLDGPMNENAVVVPGHTGDMVAGNHLASYLYYRDDVSAETVVSVPLARHYIDGFNTYHEEYEEEFKSRIAASAKFSGGSGIEAMEAVERWNWRERQSKWIVSYIKQYEFLNLDWWLPMWDRDFVAFWMDTSISQRIGKSYYADAAQQIYEFVSSDPVPAPEKSLKEKLQTAVAGTRFETALRPLHRLMLRHNTPDPEDVYDWEKGIVDYDTFEKMFNGDTSARSYRARLLLDEMDVST